MRQRTDQTVCRIANQPIDVKPEDAPAKVAMVNANRPAAQPLNSGVATTTSSNQPPMRRADASTSTAAGAQAQRNDAAQWRAEEIKSSGRPDIAIPRPLAPQAVSVKKLTKNELHYLDQKTDGNSSDFDARTAAWLQTPSSDRALTTTARTAAERGPTNVQAAAWSQGDNADLERRWYELDIPHRVPGSETPRVFLPRDDALREEAIQQNYPPLPPLPFEPRPLPGPDGRPYTLTDLQRIAAANSPVLRQAIADVQQAGGMVTQARTYQNPIATYFADPTNNNATTGVQGIGVEQVITTGGKRKLAAASAQKGVENAQIALRRARYDLATQVRQAYFALLVDKETLAVTRAVARITDEIYRLQVGMVRAGPVAGYEPTPLRAQAYATRLAYQQAIVTYMYDWKSLVALLGLEQLPLTEVAGQVDRFIPYYDYDQLLAYTLTNHTDILAARNLVPQAQYGLKLARAQLVPDLDVSYKLARDFTVLPFGTYQQFQLQLPLGVWDRNKGNIIAAQASLVRATEQQHTAARDLTNRLADAYTNYQNNLYAIDYYRRYILPDLVRYYRGVYARRPLDPDVNVGDLAFAQQQLSQNVTSYLQVLGSLWQSVVTVADFLQTDDLFQMATPRPLPQLPDFEELSRWACGHAAIAASCGVDAGGRPNPAPPPAPPARQSASRQPPAKADRREAAPVHPTAGRRTTTAPANQRRKEDK